MEFGSIRWAVEMWLMPPGGSLLLALGALALLILRREPVSPRLRHGALLAAFAGVAITLLLALPLVSGLLAAAWESGAVAPSEAKLRGSLAGAPAPGAVVILGGGTRQADRESEPGQHPNRRTLERLAHGAWVARLTGLPLLVTGGAGSVDVEPESEVMARTLARAFGLNVRWREHRSANTAENARRSASMLRADGVSHIILVTHAYHMPRSAAAFRAAGLQVTEAPHNHFSSPGLSAADFIPSASSLEVGWLVLHEMLGQAWYRMTGRL